MESAVQEMSKSTPIYHNEATGYFSAIMLHDIISYPPVCIRGEKVPPMNVCLHRK